MFSGLIWKLLLASTFIFFIPDVPINVVYYLIIINNSWTHTFYVKYSSNRIVKHTLVDFLNYSFYAIK